MGNSERDKDNLSEWAEALSRSVITVGKLPEGENWKTYIELKTFLGIGKEKLKILLRELNADNRLETFTGSLMSKTAGVCCRQVWYRIIDTPATKCKKK